MLPDYYAILGVAPGATFAELKAAYRQKVLTYHPDRGGTHEQMVQVNEAWEVLSSPKVRVAYDAARRDQHDADAQAAASRQVGPARERAQHYPDSSQEMQHWLDAMRQDFAETTYAQRNFLHWQLPMPSPNSRSGMQFVFVGILLGILVGEMIRTPHPAPRLISLFFGEFTAPGQPRAPVSIANWSFAAFYRFTRIAIDGFLGLAVAVYIHRGLRAMFVPPLPEPAVPPHAPEAASPMPQERVVVQCPAPNCGQRLRIPVLNHDVHVRCGKCGHRFVKHSTGGKS